MKMIALITMVAIILEALVEYGKTIGRMVIEQDYKTAITQGITIILGIALAFVFHLQFFNEGISEMYEGLAINPVIDSILTGILFSRGSNYVSDLISRLQRKTTLTITDKVDAAADDDDDDFIDDINEEELADTEE